HPMGIGIVAGSVSGASFEDGSRAALEFLDFDDAAILDIFLDLAKVRGFGSLVEQLPLDRTPGGGGHMAYLCTEWASNQKLAQRQIGVLPNGAPEVKTLIETRGEGGQCVVAPTPPGIHPKYPERGYEMVHGDWAEIPVITPEARQALLECAKALNEHAEAIHAPPHAKSHHPTVDRLSNDFNSRISQDDVRAMLMRHGWTVVHQHQGTDYL